MNAIKVFKLQRIERATRKRQIAEYKMRQEAMLLRGLFLPFAEGMPLIREAIKVNYHVAFRDEVVKWCVQHATEIQTLVDFGMLETIRKPGKQFGK